ncbi:ATG8-interacting protein 1 isoform X1 [Arachis ipaensis]|uniref:ATG8-interacting protein 1 isoform X1 n=1 Tax=Arachis ipaensis TaxID=130454 RepID=UPI0007AF93D9|nr:ATG8-interacting protein 1 isoform X1 [Arachis ipaensis]XP_020965183.1 ATG8-interacting protein 1 isoform X1 [Arachis ipaensis]XP_020965185.1 ATG8-interacting protein 1 isoform X1 [Arachis ipaensis]XP_020965186.1 ATG8-interacting protein 1 isoform X1 [Arachis ipaensis]XP_025670844.1 ATG8-interacting protein 1 isoform X1 [Arachis hypogaea]XP_025670845.1 ATG8-interacting protein 1 isoform X1 [Arachis hypogaea]QHN96839.1 ATG8-interacting protein [Arachis hypogaea]
MADNENVDEKTSRGADWEVVSLTASTYAAAPGPDEVELKDGNKEDIHAQDEAETSRALFMSGHFVFPPSQHENLPVEPDCSEIHDESGSKDVASESTNEEGTRSVGKGEENLTFPGLNVSEDFEGIPYFDEKISRLSVYGKQFEEGTTLPGFDLTGKEETLYDSAKYTSFHSETAIGGVPYGEIIGEAETEQGSNTSPNLAESKTPSEDDKCSSSNLPCGAWWKRRAASLYAHAKDTSTFWSVFIAAAVMGLVMLGHRWQQERALQLKWLSVNDEQARSRVLVPLYRLKDVIVGGHRRGSLIRGGSSGET